MGPGAVDAALRAVGLLLGISEVLRSIGLPLLAVFAVYMIIRRVSWRRIAAAIVVCLLPVFAYAGVFMSSTASPR